MKTLEHVSNFFSFLFLYFCSMALQILPRQQEQLKDAKPQGVDKTRTFGLPVEARVDFCHEAITGLSKRQLKRCSTTPPSAFLGCFSGTQDGFRQCEVSV